MIEWDDELAKKQRKIKEEIEAERAKLTEPQQRRLDIFCADLKEKKHYTPQAEIKAAGIIRTLVPVHREGELRALMEGAENAAIDKQNRAFAADDARKEARAQEAAERKAEEARAAEQRQAQEQAKQEQERQAQEAKQQAATEAAQREPLPRSVAQFETHLDPKAKAERDAATRATDAAKAINRGSYYSGRSIYTRYDGLTAHHAAKAPARASYAFGGMELQSRQPPPPQPEPPKPPPERDKSNSPFASLPFVEKRYVAIRNAPDNTRPTQRPASEPNNTMRTFAPLTPAQVVARDNAPAERKYLAVRDAQEGRSEGMSGDAKRFLAVRPLDNNGRPNGNGRGGPGR